MFEDPTFKLFQDTLDAEMKRLTGQGIGATVRQANAFSEDQEERLWNLHLLGAISATSLLNTMVFLIGKNFSLRSGKEHRSLKFSQVRLDMIVDMIFAFVVIRLITFFLFLVWFTSNPVGHNSLGDTDNNMCREAGIDGYFTNHSLRATTATRGLEKGIPEKFIIERTGHRGPYNNTKDRRWRQKLRSRRHLTKHWLIM